MKAHYDHQPARMEDMKNGSYLWRWNIQPTETTDPQTGEIRHGWECDEVTIWNIPDQDKVKVAAINETWGTNAEAKLINDYNGFVLGVLGEDKKQNYIDFINHRAALKADIEAYFNTL